MELKQIEIKLIYRIEETEETQKLEEILHLSNHSNESNDFFGDWNYTLECINRNTKIELTPPPDAPIGKYILFVNMIENNEELHLDDPKEIIILCNPWCKEDKVYLDSNEEKEEYVLNDESILWYGELQKKLGRVKRNHKLVDGFLQNEPLVEEKTWNLGLYEDTMLDTILYIVQQDYQLRRNEDKIKFNFEHETIAKCNLQDPVWISRIITSAVNGWGKTGLLKAKWDHCYMAGVDPSVWNDSISIIDKYNEQNKRAVCFGQCWCYAFLTTTACRVLGIPCRPLACFDSAVHKLKEQRDASFVVHRYMGDVNVDVDPKKVWNYHCWNEVYIKGPKFWPNEYDGWSVIDATPQNVMQDQAQCGPAPKKAILTGQVHSLLQLYFITRHFIQGRHWI